jgi:hypothetical protein
MDLALGIHQSSLESAVSLHSCAIEMCEAFEIHNHASRFTSMFGAYIEAVAKSLALCMEFHRSCLALLVPYGLPRDLPFATNFSSQAAATMDDLSYHMDVAIGGRSFAAQESVVSGADFRVAAAAQQVETDEDEMDIAIGSRAA